MGYGNDRTFTAQQWRVVVSVACGILIAGVGLGVLIGRMTAAPEVPPATATILPDVLPTPVTTVPAPAAPSDEDLDEPAPVRAPTAAPPPPSAPTPVPVKPVPPPAPVVQTAAAPKPERPAPPPNHVETKPKPVPTKVAPAEPGADAAPGGPRWVVQLGAFQSSDHANLLVNTLAAHGQPAHVTYAQNAAGQGWFYVQTPPYRSAAAAKSAAQSLAAREHLPTYLVKLPDPAG